MTLIMRKTEQGDVLAAEQALTDGKAALRALGVPQWQGEYPDRIDIEEDRAHGNSFVAVDEAGAVLGVLALSLDGEETYDVIDGAWLTDSTSSNPCYAVIHRCAVSAAAAHRGVMSFMFRECEHIARERGAVSMRIDTHRANLPLQGLARKCGYTLCGTITLPYERETDPERLAFEKLL